MRDQKLITHEIIGAFFEVCNCLGFGFLEKVYENAMLIALKKRGLKCAAQVPVAVRYQEVKVGQYFCDLMIEDRVIVELKAAEGIHPNHQAQLLNYLKATDIEIGLLLNFGTKAEFKRVIFSNDLRKSV